MDIPPSRYHTLEVYTEEGTVPVSLDEVNPCVRASCRSCGDMTAEFSDLSVGSARLPEGWEEARGWNQVIVRTGRGSDLLELARRRGVLEFREVPAGNWEKLKAASLAKKRAAAAHPAVRRDAADGMGIRACEKAPQSGCRRIAVRMEGLMPIDRTQKEGTEVLLMGNEAIARGALEAGVRVAAGYPGTPSSEIIETLSRFAETGKLYVEWSTNEKVAMEVAAAASFAGLRSLCVMKQNGVNVASDFLLHLTGSGTRGGMVLVTCDDPGALSSVNEGESRHFARLMEIPLIEPADFQEAKEMTRWAFALSEEIRNIVMLRSVTRMSHASGNVVLGALPPAGGKAEFRCDGPVADPERGPMISAPVIEKHRLQQEKIRKAVALFETSPFNAYAGPERPELLIITSSACTLYSREAVSLLGAEGRVGILKLGTTWPVPPALLKTAPVGDGEGPDRRGGPPVSRRAGQDPGRRAGAGDRDQDLLREE